MLFLETFKDAKIAAMLFCKQNDTGVKQHGFSVVGVLWLSLPGMF